MGKEQKRAKLARAFLLPHEPNRISEVNLVAELPAYLKPGLICYMVIVYEFFAVFLIQHIDPAAVCSDPHHFAAVDINK